MSSQIDKQLQGIRLSEKEEEDLPHIYYTELPKTTGGRYYGTQPVILLNRDRKDKEALAHELGHFYLNHSREVQSVSELIRNELAANRWSYKRTGYPKSIKEELYGIINSSREKWNVSLRDITTLISKELTKRGTPKNWKKEFRVVRKEARILTKEEE